LAFAFGVVVPSPPSGVAPPLDAAAYERLRDRCVAAGGPVLRGFVAGFGAGVLGAGALGSVFVEADGELWLQAPSGVRQPVLVELQDWCARAESSGVKALQDVVLRMRRYVPA
jgi:stearoyl-CoA desaturase (delta-9 desaturase)